jgi:hypothetical protein
MDKSRSSVRSLNKHQDTVFSSIPTSLRFFVGSSLASLNPSDFNIMSSTLMSGAAIEFLDAISLLKHAVIVDGHRDDTSTTIVILDFFFRRFRFSLWT